MPTSDLSSWLCHSRGTHKSALGTIFSAWLEAWQEAWQGEVEEKSAGCWGSAACWQLSWRRPSSTEVIYGNKDKVGYIFSDPWRFNKVLQQHPAAREKSEEGNLAPSLHP